MGYYVLSLYFFAALGCYISHGEIFKCDPVIVHKIKQLWHGHYQKHLIRTAIDNRQEVVIAATPGYYSPDAGCVYSLLSRDVRFAPSTTVTIHTTYKNGTIGERSIYIGEYKGTAYETCVQVRRYHVYYKNGVTGVYACSEAPDASEGVPQGFLKIRAADYDLAAVDEARQILYELDVHVSIEYPWQCPESESNHTHEDSHSNTYIKQ